jgi:hypothetical protein
MVRFLHFLCWTGPTVPPASPVQEARLRAPGAHASLHRTGTRGALGSTTGVRKGAPVKMLTFLLLRCGVIISK